MASPPSPSSPVSRPFLIADRRNVRCIRSGGELPLSNGIDEYGIDSDIDSDLRVILRKLTKKDSTTKIRVKWRLRRLDAQLRRFSPKAFNELRDYCDANDSDEKIRAILPFFVSHYRKWSTVGVSVRTQRSSSAFARRTRTSAFATNVSSPSIPSACE